jgi:hypothetical protein
VDCECVLNLVDEQRLRSDAEQLNQLYKKHI